MQDPQCRSYSGAAARACVLVGIFLLVQVAADPCAAQDHGDAEVLAIDDVCLGPEVAEDGASSPCGLSLRQLRGERAEGKRADALQPGPVGTPMTAADIYATLMTDDIPKKANGSSGWLPWDPSLAKPSSGKLLTFYMYRTVSDEVYPPVNVNTANLAGALWYLHHEVVIQYPRKFEISRIMRFKVQMRATEPLVNLGMNFGPRMAFDSGQCTGPHVCGRTSEVSPEPEFCAGAFVDKYDAKITDISGRSFNGSYEYDRFGYHVGCNNLGQYPFPMFQVYYPGAAWYSLPGPCPSHQWNKHTAECMAMQPGGLCKGEPTGQGNCTWNYELMGEIYLDELTGSVDELHARGGREYNPVTDKGIDTSFWDGINDTDANARRIKAAQKLFAKKYPNQTLDEDMPPPPCDFNFGQFYHEFYWKDPFSGTCEDAQPGSACYKSVKWSMTDGIYGNPKWYPGLTPKSSFKEFQRLLYVQGKAECPHRPCPSSEEP